MGRTKDDNMFTFDKFHMEMTVDIRDADFIELVGAPTTTHPFIGKYWAVKGGPDVAGYRANKLSVLAQQNESPAGL